MTPQPENKPPLIDAKPPVESNNTKKEPTAAEATPKNSRSKLLWGFTLLILLIGAAWAALWFLYFRFHESTDDAYSNGNMVNINSVISGSVIAYYCDNTQFVKEGQLIVSLDPTEAQIAFDNEMATLGNIVLQVRQLYNAVEVSRSNVESKKYLLAKAKFNYDNRLKLHETHPLSVSVEDFIHSRDDYLVAQADYQLAEKQLNSAEAAAGNTPLIHHSLIEKQKANIRQAFYNLRHCSIYAPTTGYVAQRAVEIGQRVTTEMNLMAIIPTDYVWVDANYKETQLTYMRVGQPATVWFDIYGSDVKFEGKVLGIASGSGSIFSLIPPQNATGNWIKIVQRLPVRISLDPEMVKQYPIRLGISAEVNVNITDQNLPRMVEIIYDTPIATTNIFELDFKNVNELMDKVIQKNLPKQENEDE